jgi:hypothetical protein
MKRRLIPFINALSVLICVIAVVVWTASYRSKISLSWTSGDEHNQIITDSGIAYYKQVHRWWRYEGVRLESNPQPGTSDVATWPGMRIDHHYKTLGIKSLGFEHASGIWKSPFIEVTEAKKFLLKDMPPPKPPTLYSSTTPTDIYACPLWFIVMVTALFPAFRIWKRRQVRVPINA